MHNNSTFFSTRPQHFVLEPHITCCCSPRLLLLHNIFSCNACFFSSSSTLRLLWHHVRYTLLATMCFVCSSVKLFRFCVSFVDLLKWKHNAYSTLFLTTTSKSMMMLIEGCTTKKKYYVNWPFLKKIFFPGAVWCSADNDHLRKYNA